MEIAPEATSEAKTSDALSCDDRNHFSPIGQPPEGSDAPLKAYSYSIKMLLEIVPQVSPSTIVRDVKKIVDRNAPLSAVVVSEGGRPAGLVMSHHLDRTLGMQFGVQLYYDRAVTRIMDPSPLVVEGSVSVEAAGRRAMGRERDKIYDHIIIAEDNLVIGVVSVWKILDFLADLHQKRTCEMAYMNRRLQAKVKELEKTERALKDSERQLRILSSRLLTAQETERKRISRELHDSIGGALSTIRFGLENAVVRMQEGRASPENLESLISITQYAHEEARRIYMNLRPSTLDDLGILATIGWFLRQFQTIHSEISIESHISVEEDETPQSLKIVIFRVLQEALQNVARHGRADTVNLSLVKQDDRIVLTIADNGTGFQVGVERETPEGGLGLPSMQERVESSGGIFTITSVKGEGTVVRASWELSRIVETL